MIKEKIDVKSWSQFLEEIKKIKLEYPEKDFLYRGEPSSDTPLSTTLERYIINKKFSLEQYYKFASSLRTEIETITEIHWHIPSEDEFYKWLTERQTLAFSSYPGYEYFAYLRHHGFPSPLLDWTRSYYIAAFFAFENAHVNPDGIVSVFCFLRNATVGRMHEGQTPGIHVLGPNIKTHKRHLHQQSEYSFCVLDSSNKKENMYENHMEVFRNPNPHQDLLWELNMSISERKIVLNELDKMNINAFSLFGSEDALIKTLTTRKILNL